MQRLVIRVLDGKFEFFAGQYLEVIHSSGGTIPLSIASSPRHLPDIHLHYRSTPGNQQARWLDEILDSGRPLNIQGPSGNVFLSASSRAPLLLVAGGTGAAQALAIIDDVHTTGGNTSVTLLALVDEPADFYFRDWLAGVAGPWLDTELIADARRGADNSGLQWLGANAARFVGHRIILAGSPDFVYAAADVLTAHNIGPQQLESDVFAYAPR